MSGAGVTLLVAGGDRVDAGKTTFSTGLLARLAAEGAAPRGFKPRAGNDHWFDHDDVRAATGDGRLYGKDARRLADAAAGDAAPEAINPVHRLWRPTPGRTGLLGEADRTFLVDRVRAPAADPADAAGPADVAADPGEFVVNAAAEREGLLPGSVREALPLADAARVDSVAGFNEVMADRYLPAFGAVADRVRAAPTAVVESYADVAAPLRDLAADAVAVVEPTRARVYDGDRYATAREAARGGADRGRLEERTATVVGMLEPLATVDLPPLPAADRGSPDRVAAAYAEAYDALLEAAPPLTRG